MKKRLYIPVLATGLIISGGLSSSLSASSYTKEVLAEGAPISGGVNGIIIDTSNNHLYAASFYGGKIYRIDRETGDILEEFGSEKGVEMPDDLIVGTDGSLYWTATMTGDVGRLSPDRSTSTVRAVAPWVNPITFSDDGRLFTAADFFNTGVYELNPITLEVIADSDPFVDPDPINGTEQLQLNGMVFGPDGLLYGPVSQEGKLVSMDVDQGIITQICDGLPLPFGVKFNSQGEMFVVDGISGKVSRIDPQTGNKTVIAQQDHPGLDQLAFDSDGRLFVSNANDGSIMEVLSNGDTRTVTEAGMITPGGIAVLPRVGSIPGDVGISVFVADSFSIREFDGATGTPMSTGWVFEEGFFGSMTASADGNNLVLSSWLFNSVQVWNWNSATPRVVEEYLDFATPVDAIRFQGNLVVTEVGSDLQTPRVILVTPTNVRTTLADATDGLVVPAGLAAKDGDLWISDQATGKILQIIDDGMPLSSPIVVAEGLSSPEGIAVYRGNKLLVVEAGANRLSKVKINNGKVRTIATGFDLGRQGPSTAPPTFIFNGVSADSSGVIYMTAEIDNVVYRITPNKRHFHHFSNP